MWGSDGEPAREQTERMPTDEDWAYFHRCTEGLQALYAGRWVLIYQGRLRAVYDHQDDAFAAASGLGPCLIHYMGALPPLRDLTAQPVLDEME